MDEMPQQFSVDLNSRLRDVEQRQQLMKDRVLLLGKSLIDDRQQISQIMRELKTSVLLIKEENSRLKEIVKNVTEQLEQTARKEELFMIQRQLEILRK